ncbi:MAG: hypothetical protein K8I60_19240 [Anaerolineae bacterium]|nr:hypothetical protein [Anaerolineae bacterium]
MQRNRKKEGFMYHVELHERAWGMDGYPGRPSLEDIMTAPVVAFWYNADPNRKRETRYFATVHQDISELNRYVSRMVLHSTVKIPDRRLTRLFVQRQEVIIRGVKLVLAKIESTE